MKCHTDRVKTMFEAVESKDDDVIERIHLSVILLEKDPVLFKRLSKVDMIPLCSLKEIMKKYGYIS